LDSQSILDTAATIVKFATVKLWYQKTPRCQRNLLKDKSLYFLRALMLFMLCGAPLLFAFHKFAPPISLSVVSSVKMRLGVGQGWKMLMELPQYKSATQGTINRSDSAGNQKNKTKRNCNELWEEFLKYERPLCSPGGTGWPNSLPASRKKSPLQ
jgi:hypothetical protein